jgi:hypothetical protein
VCQICETNEHSTNDCPTLFSFKECIHEQATALNGFQTQIITHTCKCTTLVGEIIQISVGRVVTIMHKLHNHHFKPTIIFKILKDMHLFMLPDTTKRLMSSPKCRSVEVINNPARPGSNHREVNCINYKQQ